MLATLTALVLLAASLALVWYVTGLVWRAALPPLGSLLERRRFDRHVARARRGDRYLRAGQLAEALSQFEAALYPYPASTRAMAESVIRHHTGLLSRLIAAADQRQGERVRLISLAKTDRLFHERRALQQRYLTLCQSGSRERLRELERELRGNTRELRSTLALLVAEIAAPGEQGQVH